MVVQAATSSEFQLFLSFALEVMTSQYGRWFTIEDRD
jgi:hypothetical protein